MDTKKRRVLSYAKMDDELKAAFEEKYPHNDYIAEAMKYEKPNGESFYAVTIETEDTIALIKVDVKTDAAEDLERWLDAEAGEDTTTEEEGENLPDDNISQYSNGEDDPADSE